MTGRPASAARRPRRIAHLVCTDKFAGTERHIVTLCAAIARARPGAYELTVYGGDEASMRDGLAGTGIEWLPAPSPRAGLAALLRAGRLDLVHTHLTAADTVAVAASVRNRAPVLATRHIAKTRGSSLAARAAGAVVTRRLAGQIAVSQYVADIVEGESTVIYAGVEAGSGPIRGAADRSPTVLVAQRLEVEKRTDVAIRGWAASGLGARGWTLQLAGDGAERTSLQGLTAELGVADSVQFLGWRDDIAELRARASILLASPPGEPYGLSVVEAMSEGLPVVAAGAGGHAETLGLVADAALFAVDDPAAAGILLAELAGDPARRDLLGKRSVEAHRQHLSVASSVEATTRLYEILMA